MHDSTTASAVIRYQDGWRTGKPVEDPDKLKRWGFVTAKPSEYLVCTRRGQIDRSRSGQGARIFKWPWEQVAIVPTTLQRIEFVADQITRERVGVTVTGIAVYRIAEPELAYRVLNFSYGEAASEKLAATLREMFIGAARRLIANLALDECLMRRKEAIAAFLMAEIAPVVGGEGSPLDTTERGWGVVIDTIEIQDVQIQSTQVFAHLQAPFRAEIGARARRAQAEADVAAIAAETARADAAHRQAAREIEQERERRALAQTTELELRRQASDVDLELRRHEAEAKQHEGELDAIQQRRLAEIEQLLVQGRALRELVSVGLPQIAAAFQQSFGTINYTQIGEGAGPLGLVAGAIREIVGVARGLGLDPAALTSRGKDGDS